MAQLKVKGDPGVNVYKVISIWADRASVHPH